MRNPVQTLMIASAGVQIMVLLTSALRAELPSELRLQALEGWMAIMRALTRTPSLHSHFISIMDQARGALAIPRGWRPSIAGSCLLSTRGVGPGRWAPPHLRIVRRSSSHRRFEPTGSMQDDLD